MAGLQAQIDQLSVRAPFSGRIADKADGLQPGTWVASRQKLVQLVGTAGARGEAFVTESELRRLHENTSVSFIADTPGSPGVQCRLGVIDQMNLSIMDSFYVASTYGGAIPVQKDHSGALVPTEAIFRVRLEECEDTAPAWQMRGVAHLDAGWSSPAADFIRRAVTAVQREMGF